MDKEFKKIAKGLGIILPACLLSIGAANATAPMRIINSEVPSISIKKNKGNDVICHLMENATNYTSDKYSPEHTDSHSNYGGNHSDRHSNSDHGNRHTNNAASTYYTNVRNDDGTYTKVPSCRPHSDTHTNRDRINSHTNVGNKYHTDQHTNRDYKRDC